MESTKTDTGKATVSSLGDMTRLYANKNIWAVLKQEMKNGNITKTFPRADIWAGCQFFFKNHCQWQFSRHSIWRQLCRQTAYERKMPTSLSGCNENKPQHQAKCCFRRWNAFWESTLGEMAEIRPPQFGTRKPLRFKDKLPTYSHQIQESVGTQSEKLWLVFSFPNFL